MSEELNEVAAPVAPEASAPAAEVSAQNEQTPETPAPTETDVPVVAPEQQCPEGSGTIEATAEPQPLKDNGIGMQSPAAEAEAPASEQVPTPEQPAPTPAPAAQAKPAPKFKPRKVNKDGTPKFQSKYQQRQNAHHAPTDEEVKAKWKNTLMSDGHFEEKFVDALTAYAVEHKGFDPQRSWGGTLVTMFNRMGERLANLPEFSAAQGEYIFRQLQKFQMDLANVIGESPDDWNDRSRFEDNYSQRKAVDEYFGINLPLYKISALDLPLVSIRQAAWPSKKEEEKGIGGTFCDRWVYFILALMNFLMDEEMAPLIFSKVVHDKVIVKPDWIDDNGLCKKCGSTVVEDSHGRKICSSLMCEHHFARSSTSGFIGQSTRPTYQPRQNRFSEPSATPQRDWKGKDRRHERTDDGDMPSQKQRHHGKKFRVRDDGDFEQPVPEANREPVTIQATAGSENLGNLGSTFESLGL